MSPSMRYISISCLVGLLAFFVGFAPFARASDSPVQHVTLRKGGAIMTLTLTSPAFANGGEIPARFTCDGQDLSPALEWSGLPEGTKSVAMIVDDPDAPDPAAPRHSAGRPGAPSSPSSTLLVRPQGPTYHPTGGTRGRCSDGLRPPESGVACQPTDRPRVGGADMGGWAALELSLENQNHELPTICEHQT